MANVEGQPLANTARQPLPTLTGLRFVAASLVFLSHAGRILTPHARSEMAWLVGGGHVGVGFFFLLSGFVLMWTARPGDTARSFYRRRFARIYPSHLTTWFVAALLVVLADSPGASRLGAGLGAVLLQAWVPNQSVYYALNGVAWSLSAEMFFYLTFPLYAVRLLGFDARIRRAIALLSAGIIVVLAAVASVHIPTGQLTYDQVAGTWLWALYNLPLTRALEFVIGVVLAIEVRNGLRLPHWSLTVGLVLVAGTFVLSGVVPSAYGIVAWTLLPFAVVILASAGSDLRGEGTWFASSTWVLLGQWSFAFYLVHQMIIYLVLVHASPQGSLWVWAAEVLGLLLAAVVASAGLYYAIERPFERRLRRGKSHARHSAATGAGVGAS